MRVTFVLALLVLSASAEIVDRVAVSFGTEVITASEIDERLRLTAFQNRTPVAANATTRKEAAEQLIDQRLVLREMQMGHYSALSESDAAALLTSYIKENFTGPDSFQKTLAPYHLRPEQLQRDLARQADLLTFLNLRFRPAVQVTDEDIRKFYRERVEPKNTPERSMTFNDARSAIEETLTTERADRELDLWLKDQRRRVKIEYHAETLGTKTQ